jgi:hypothetical protein
MREGVSSLSKEPFSSPLDVKDTSIEGLFPGHLGNSSGTKGTTLAFDEIK